MYSVEDYKREEKFRIGPVSGTRLCHLIPLALPSQIVLKRRLDGERSMKEIYRGREKDRPRRKTEMSVFCVLRPDSGSCSEKNGERRGSKSSTLDTLHREDKYMRHHDEEKRAADYRTRCAPYCVEVAETHVAVEQFTDT